MTTTNKLGRFTLRALAALCFTFGFFELIGRDWGLASASLLGWILFNVARDRVFPEIKSPESSPTEVDPQPSKE